MESVGVFLAGVLVVWLVFWTILNEKAKSIRDQRGFFRMRDWQHKAPPVKKSDSPQYSNESCDGPQPNDHAQASR